MMKRSYRRILMNRRLGFDVMAEAVLSTLLAVGVVVAAQNPTPNPEGPKKANARPPESLSANADPFGGATVEKMSGKCVTLETEQGSIVIEMLPVKAPESVRGFLNLAATGALDT